MRAFVSTRSTLRASYSIISTHLCISPPPLRVSIHSSSTQRAHTPRSVFPSVFYLVKSVSPYLFGACSYHKPVSSRFHIVRQCHLFLLPQSSCSSENSFLSFARSFYSFLSCLIGLLVCVSLLAPTHQGYVSPCLHPNHSDSASLFLRGASPNTPLTVPYSPYPL